MHLAKTLGTVAALGAAFVLTQTIVTAQRGAAPMPAGVHTMPTGANAAPELVSGTMMTLYTFAKDQPGVSNCNDMCAKNWPPLAAAADAKPMGDWTVVTRADGSKQWAYKGRPLYTWIKDGKPGDATGDNMGQGAWKIALP